MKTRLFLLMTFSVAAGLIAACQPSGNPSSSKERTERPQVGFHAPPFRLSSLEGKEVSLTSLRGKVVFLNFWATWCFPCRAEMPSMELLYRDFKDRGLEILAIAHDPEGADVVRPFVEELGLTYPILLDTNFGVDEVYQIRSVPTSYLLNREGVITHKFIGAMDWNTPEFRNAIGSLLKAEI